MTIQNKIYAFFTVSFFSLMTYSTNVLSSQSSNVPASSTNFAGTKVGTANHSGMTKAFLLCNAGTGAGDQLCVIYLQIIAGAKGQIDINNDSKISLGLTSITASSSGGSYVTNPNVSVNITQDQPGGLSISQPTPDASAAVRLIDSVEVAAIKAGSNLDQANGMTGVKCRVFNGNTVPDAKYASSTYALPGTDKTQDIVKANASNEALFLLSGFHNNAAFNRALIGYADRFTISYNITVVSSTVGSSQTCP